MSTVREWSVRTPAGLYAGRATGYEPSTARLLRVVERVTRGLFFHHQGEPLGLSYSVLILADGLIDWTKHSDEDKELCRRLVAHASGGHMVAVGRAFCYRRLQTIEDARLSTWLMTFYDCMTFLCVTGPPKGESNR